MVDHNLSIVVQTGLLMLCVYRLFIYLELIRVKGQECAGLLSVLPSGSSPACIQ